MQIEQPTTLAELVAPSIPDLPTAADNEAAKEAALEPPIPTLADLVAHSVPDSPLSANRQPSDLILRNYGLEAVKPARIGFTERRLREGRWIMGWRMSTGS